LVNICPSYHKNKRVSFYMAHSVYLRVALLFGWWNLWIWSDKKSLAFWGPNFFEGL